MTRCARHGGLATVLLLALSVFAASLPAADQPLGFSDQARQQRYDGLLKELRCLVCQNQSLADSHAELAQDLRNEVHRMVAEGRSQAEVIDFMVARYGDFVLYRPPLKATTSLLWLAPLALLIVALLVFLRRTSTRGQTVAELSDEERERLRALIDEQDSKP